MARMDAAYREGWGGHIEAAWASILDFHGLKLEDIGGDAEFVRPGNRHRFYLAAKPNAKCDYWRRAPSWPSRRCTGRAARRTGSITR